ncbi:MAG: hypothetical protein M0Z71_05150 [Nitrospiraceae bacterium]|nr:hypothetical protein [Nitrospiraceae bacterium]
MYEKQIKMKGLGAAVTVTVTQLQKINSYALAELKPEEIYVRRFLIAHNGVDRDNERFPEDCLDGFMQTLPGKSVLRGHNRNEMPCGLFFDAYKETMSPAQFLSVTGEKINLPDSILQAQALYGWVYFLRNDTTKDLIASMDAGILRYVSIGFRAADRREVRGEANQAVYEEYVAPAEALEGSIVWLGAQPGAVIKGADGLKKPVSRGDDYLIPDAEVVNKEADNPLGFDDEARGKEARGDDYLIPDAEVVNKEADNPLGFDDEAKGKEARGKEARGDDYLIPDD